LSYTDSPIKHGPHTSESSTHKLVAEGLCRTHCLLVRRSVLFVPTF